MKTQYTVLFSKFFTNGNLKGLMFDARLSFPTLDAAAEYVNFCHKHISVPVKAVGGGDYTIHMSRIETINASQGV